MRVAMVPRLNDAKKVGKETLLSKFTSNLFSLFVCMNWPKGHCDMSLGLSYESYPLNLLYPGQNHEWIIDFCNIYFSLAI